VLTAFLRYLLPIDLLVSGNCSECWLLWVLVPC
jgi:hypothetical protein